MRLLLPISILFVFSCDGESNYHNEEMVWVGDANLFVSKNETTTAEFAEFVKTTAYQTTADSLGWAGVFTGEEWEKLEGANWQYPQGKDREMASLDEPVSQVSYYDACAYCDWKGGRLPTSKEWNLLAGKPNGKGNTWDGVFPFFDQGDDGYKASIAPVGQFMPNENQLHDVFGNVWEWTNTSKRDSLQIIKGGSFLCAANYCSGYIPERFQTTAKNSSLNHLGFRCVFEKLPNE